jgi:hypothetical protein
LLQAKHAVGNADAGYLPDGQTVAILGGSASVRPHVVDLDAWL